MAALPPDAAYDAQIAGLQRQRDDTLANLTQGRAGGLLDYGYTEGPGGALAFDPNNPFSKAALLKVTYDRSRRSSAQSMGAGGQLYSGAFQNQQDLVNRNELQGNDALQKSLSRFLAQTTQQRTAAGTNYETSAGSAYGERVSRFQSNPAYSPATPGDPVAAATAAAAAVPAAAGKPAAARSPGSSYISGYQNIPQYKNVNGKLYRMTASGKWMPLKP
jgi:hypothetical protein